MLARSRGTVLEPTPQKVIVVQSGFRRFDMAKTALLVDVLNLHLCLQGIGRELSVTELIARAGGWARIAEIRSFGDSRDLPPWLRRRLAASGVLPIDVPSHGADGARIVNAADLVLACDLIEISILRDDIGTIVLASGDGDLALPLARARRYGKGVMVIGVRGLVAAGLVEVAGANIVYLNGDPQRSPVLVGSMATYRPSLSLVETGARR